MLEDHRSVTVSQVLTYHPTPLSARRARIHLGHARSSIPEAGSDFSPGLSGCWGRFEAATGARLVCEPRAALKASLRFFPAFPSATVGRREPRSERRSGPVGSEERSECVFAELLSLSPSTFLHLFFPHALVVQLK